MKAPLPKIFEGKTVAIVGSGPSLTGVDLSALSGHQVIALNLAFESLPMATMLWWSDSYFWRWHRDHILDHRAAYKVTGDIGYVAADELPEAVTQYHFSGAEGFDENPANLRHGNNSAYASMHLSAHLGAARIVLFGVDMRHGPNGETHFHRDTGIYNDPNVFEKKMLPLFAGLVEPLKTRNIEVLNASPASALTLWPRISVAEGMAAIGKNDDLAPRGDPPVNDPASEVAEPGE